MWYFGARFMYPTNRPEFAQLMGLVHCTFHLKRTKDSVHVAVITASFPCKQVFLFQNSWGSEWGAKGFGVLPYDFFTQYNAAGSPGKPEAYVFYV